ncbi:winged helix-turn-helix transcriptional regulator [Luteococcus sp. Sow4_B9]|uniref:winged helix-turn-helix transcriptional regulator n=1 Tax=Luteococcus sp. Sow4_B9 TaxID=3438792 RepID=UPI003F94456D
MATLAVVGPGDVDSLPAAFGLLDHALVQVSSGSWTPPAATDVVLVDGRDDLALARDACLQLAAHDCQAPVLLVVTAQALGVFGPSWGIADFVLDTAEPGEIEARIRLLRRENAGSHIVRCGPLVIDEDAYTVMLGGQPLELTYTEFELLKYFALNPGRVLSRDHLLSEVWGYDYYGGTRTVDVHVRRLRAKLGPEYDGHIGTVRNVGYRFLATRQPGPAAPPHP